MQRIDHPTKAAVLATENTYTPTTPGFFTEGNKSTGVPATRVTANWLNWVQEEIIGVVLSAGLVPSNADLNQMATAIQTLISNAVPATGNFISRNQTANLTVGYTGDVDVLTGSTLTPDLTKPYHKSYNATGSFVLNGCTGTKAGTYLLKVTQDATGGRVMSTSGIEVIRGEINTAPNAVTYVAGTYFGSGNTQIIMYSMGV